MNTKQLKVAAKKAWTDSFPAQPDYVADKHAEIDHAASGGVDELAYWIKRNADGTRKRMIAAQPGIDGKAFGYVYEGSPEQKLDRLLSGRAI